MRSSLLLATFGLLGCVSLPHAKLVVVGQGTREVIAGPVVCGPIGFRKVPLQARWGEYVRVTVAAPSVITGTVLVHANGLAQEPRSWSTESGALVIDARFPNEDPDARFALERSRPIDLTLTGLTAPNGGTCEGAVFTVEQGALVPSVDERAWIAELERRGGPELAARRERARAEAEARRQAHYAAWEARQQVEVSAAVVAQAEVIRQAHYAQWESSLSLRSGERGRGEGPDYIAAEGSVVASGSMQPSSVAGGNLGSASGSIQSSSVAGGVVAGGSVGSASGSIESSSVSGGVVAGGHVGSASGSIQSSSVSGGNLGAASGGMQSSSVAGGIVAGGHVGSASGSIQSSSVSGGVVAGGNVGSASRAVAPPAIVGGSCAAGAAVIGSGGFVTSTHLGGAACGPAAGAPVVTADSFAAPQVVPGSVGFEAALDGPTEFAAFPTASLQPAATNTTVSAAGEWSQPSDTLLRAPAQVNTTRASEVQLEAGAQVQAGWAQPYEPRLEAVAVSSESQVATAQYEASLQPAAVSTQSQVVTSAPPPASCRRCRAPVASVEVDGAALFNFMLHVGAAAAQSAAPVHAAQPVGR